MSCSITNIVVKVMIMFLYTFIPIKSLLYFTEPPIFENPAFTAQIEGAQAKQSGTLETHVICNMNLPNIKAQNQTKLGKHRTLLIH